MYVFSRKLTRVLGAGILKDVSSKGVDKIVCDGLYCNWTHWYTKHCVVMYVGSVNFLLMEKILLLSRPLPNAVETRKRILFRIYTQSDHLQTCKYRYDYNFCAVFDVNQMYPYYFASGQQNWKHFHLASYQVPRCNCSFQLLILLKVL